MVLLAVYWHRCKDFQASVVAVSQNEAGILWTWRFHGEAGCLATIASLAEGAGLRLHAVLWLNSTNVAVDTEELIPKCPLALALCFMSECHKKSYQSSMFKVVGATGP